MNTAKKKEYRYSRTRCCDTCGRIEDVRKDNLSITCNSCSARKSSSAYIASIRGTAHTCPCSNCGKIFKRVKSQLKRENYCSVACFSDTRKIEKSCESCHKPFKVYKSAINGKTNASGRFCSRSCYEHHLCRTERTTGRGSQWKRIRNIAIAKAPFCGRCGTTQNLQVHHIMPFRLTHNNDQKNLMPLCCKCHKTIECVTNDLEAEGLNEMHLGLIMRSMQQETFQMIRGAVLLSQQKAIHAVTGKEFRK